MHFQWYPGHMTKAKRMMQENIKLIDVIIELVDARTPISSKNPDIEQMSQNKIRVILLNKYDLADENETKKWKKYYEDKGYFTALVNSKSGKGVRAVNGVVMEACREKIERDRKRGIINRPVRAMIVGIPNVGKSTFINSFAGKACAKTGDKPGVTKGKQWIRLGKNIELLDTPGILWPKFEDQNVGLRLALIGSIRDEILQIEELAGELIKYLCEEYPALLNDYLGFAAEGREYEILERYALRRGCLQKGSLADTERAAALIMDDFRGGKIGRITLEKNYIPYERE
ncbi:MAG: ribosome biogenesis GTPase YlqF [Lachnospiraceae bacterium]|nr:ribosome biogenesis GTPase YlqF [Lachnospiraceae bacterium]